MSRIFIIIFLAGAVIFPAPSHAQQENAGSRHMEDSVVRYDVLEVAKNLMSCSGFFHVTEEPEQSAFFRSEAKSLFMMDIAQTEEETVSWLAGASDYYRDFWGNMDSTETFETAQAIERHRLECVNLKAARAAVRTLTAE